MIAGMSHHPIVPMKSLNPISIRLGSGSVAFREMSLRSETNIGSRTIVISATTPEAITRTAMG